MKRSIHQRNSFNNYNRMVGGMEDEYWEQRRREWEAWRAEERENMGKTAKTSKNRRERDDVNRGY